MAAIAYPQIPTPPPQSAEGEDEHWLAVPSSESTPKHFVYTKPIQTSEQDDREYRLIRLENGLEAILVHDAKTDLAAASLDVAVGHLSDPDDMPGLAHFCEHLLFMGTEQFPKENEYSEYLSKNNGYSNAYTAASNTNYYFSVGVDAFAGAIERFSGFFHSPLFSPSCTLRELNAVDSENKKNLQSDMWRIFQLNKSLTKPGHPWSKFGTGNKATLTEAARNSNRKNGDRLLSGSNATSGSASLLPSPIPSRVASPTPSVASASSESEADGGHVGRETRRRLIEWWSKEYCAGRMSLALVGKESLDDLTKYATTFFSPIVNRGQDPNPLIKDHPFGVDESGTIIHVKTIMDFRAVELSFPIPYMVDNWRVRPDSFIAHFVGHEGPGSLHAYLKKRGWITALSSGPQDLAKGFSMYKITIHLTKDGFKNYQEVVQACFKYLELLRSSHWPEFYHSERKELADIRFRFAEKARPDSYATSLSTHLKWPTPRDLVISGPKLVWDWDEKLTRRILDGLTSENSRVCVMGKNFEEIGFEGSWKSEKWYGTQYVVSKLTLPTTSRNDVPDLFLPKPNEYIPKNFDATKTVASEPLERPILIKRTALSEVWHKKDDQFKVPKAQVMIEVRTPEANSSLRASVMTKLYAELVKDSLNELAYDAELAGLNYSVGSTQLGITASVGGYNDKLDRLLQHVLEKAKNLEVRPDRLAVIKEEIQQSWENFYVGQSYQISEYNGKYLFTDGQFLYSEKSAVISDISMDELKQHIPKLLSQCNYKILVNGNLRKEDALRIGDLVESILGAKALPKDREVVELSRLLPERCNFIWEIPVPNPDEVNASISYFCHVGDQANQRLRTTFRLLAQILYEPAFNVLRTKEQLGYIVSCREWQGTEYMGLRVLVQSEKDPKYLEARIEAFLVQMRTMLEAMDEASFEEHKKGLLTQWSEKLKNLREETSRFWAHIDTGYLDFQRRKKDSVTLQTITKAEVVSLFSELIDPASPRRSKLSVHLRPQKTPPQKFSLAAAQAFLTVLRTHNVPVDEDQFLELSASEPPLAAVKAHWTGVLPNLVGAADGAVQSEEAGPSVTQHHPNDLALQNRERTSTGKDVVQKLLTELGVLSAQYPAVGDERIELSPDVVYITDPKAFKAGLRLSGPAKPAEEFYDLPLSKY